MSGKNEAILQETGRAPSRWSPQTEADRRVVREQLSRIVASLPFSTSKRYPAFLSHVVEKWLAGESDRLKERILGIEVFHRDTDYDTNSDPVVRITAGEVRKRLAQYYYDPDHSDELHIELPAGSYVPQVRPRLEKAEPEPIPIFDTVTLTQPEPIAPNVPSGERTERSPVAYWALATCLAIGLLLGILFSRLYRSYRAASASAAEPLAGIDQFWQPILSAPGPIWLCIGQVYASSLQLQPNGARSRFDTPDQLSATNQRPFTFSNLANASTLARVAGVLQSRSKSYSIHGETDTTFSDLAASPSVLIGAYDNDWTIRLADQLRYRFEMNPTTKEQWISDQQNPGQRIGDRVFGQQLSETKTVYALISRVRDQTTNQMVMAIAGVSSFGTTVAGDFVSGPAYLEDFAKHAPQNWQRENLQIIIGADVVDGSIGPPHVISSYFW